MILCHQENEFSVNESNNLARKQILFLGRAQPHLIDRSVLERQKATLKEATNTRNNTI